MVHQLDLAGFIALICCLFPIVVSRHLSTSPREQTVTPIPSNCQASFAIVVSVGFVHDMLTLCNLG